MLSHDPGQQESSAHLIMQRDSDWYIMAVPNGINWFGGVVYVEKRAAEYVFTT